LRAAQRKAFQEMPFDELFCVEYVTLSMRDSGHFQKNAENWAAFRCYGPEHYDAPLPPACVRLPEFVLLFLFVGRLMGGSTSGTARFIPGPLPLHGRAAGSAIIARPPPFTAPFWSVR
jgi:hypothetical protein